MDTHTFLYQLKDPRDGSIRYIGKARRPKSRYYWHIHDSVERQLRTPKGRWIRELQLLGMQPELLVICKVAGYGEQEETFLIEAFTVAGHPLTNVACRAGLGGWRGERSLITRKRIGDAHRGKVISETQREVARVNGRKQWEALTPEQQQAKMKRFRTYKNQLPNGGYTPSQETREKLRKANADFLRSPEIRARTIAASRVWHNRRLGRPDDYVPPVVVKDRSASLKRTLAKLTPEQMAQRMAKTREGRQRVGMTTEMKAKISASLKARAALMTPEQRQAQVAKAVNARRKISLCR